MNKKLLTLMMLGGVALAGTAFAHGDDKNNKFKSMDTNNDGQVTSAEHAAGVTKMFSGMDADRDGFVTTTEMDAYHMGMQPASAGKSPKMSSTDKIRTLDTDNDGKLSSAEHDAGAQAMFTRMDADSSGGLSQAEMASGRDKAMMKSASDKSATHDDHGTQDTSAPPSGGNGSCSAQDESGRPAFGRGGGAKHVKKD